MLIFLTYQSVTIVNSLSMTSSNRIFVNSPLSVQRLQYYCSITPDTPERAETQSLVYKVQLTLFGKHLERRQYAIGNVGYINQKQEWAQDRTLWNPTWHILDPPQTP